jgi:phage-related tail fiber protein
LTQIIDRIDGPVGDLAVKEPARVATTAAITLSGVQTVNGVSLAAGDRVLVKDQADATENGIYVVQDTAWTRAKDFDGNRDVVKSTLVWVTEGSAGGASFWRLTTASPVIFGTSSIAFAQLMTFLLDPETSTDYIRGSGAGGYERRTPTQVLGDIAAAGLAANTFTGAQNLADNELIRPKIKDYSETFVDLGTAGAGNVSQTINLELGNVFVIGRTGGEGGTDQVTFTFSNPPASASAGSFTLITTNYGNLTAVWPAGVKWPGGVAPTLTGWSEENQAAQDVLTFLTTDGGATWYSFAALDLKSP